MLSNSVNNKKCAPKIYIKYYNFEPLCFNKNCVFNEEKTHANYRGSRLMRIFGLQKTSVTQNLR